MQRHSEVIPLLLATVVYPSKHPLAGQTGVVNAFALRHPHGLILVDTGVGEGSAAVDDWYQPARRPLEQALGAHGFTVDDVLAVINTHLHFDHCGQNRRFPGVPIYVQAAEYEAALSPEFTIVEWVDFGGADYHRLEGEATLFPGVRVLPTPGHTPGHQSVLVKTAGGTVVLAGQAIQSLDEYEQLRRTGALPAGSAPADPRTYQASALRLLGYAASRVYFSHDERVWEPAEDGCERA